MAQIYKSSNNCKMLTSTGGTSKSVDKPVKKYTCNQIYNHNNLSLEKHHNKDILMKTETRGFFIEGTEDKLSGYGDNNSKKSTELTWQSTNQLPFLLMGNTSYENTTRKNEKWEKSEGKSKKPQIIIQKQTFNIKQIINNRHWAVIPNVNFSVFTLLLLFLSLSFLISILFILIGSWQKQWHEDTLSFSHGRNIDSLIL